MIQTGIIHGTVRVIPVADRGILLTGISAQIDVFENSSFVSYFTIYNFNSSDSPTISLSEMMLINLNYPLILSLLSKLLPILNTQKTLMEIMFII